MSFPRWSPGLPKITKRRHQKITKRRHQKPLEASYQEECWEHPILWWVESVSAGPGWRLLPELLRETRPFTFIGEAPTQRLHRGRGIGREANPRKRAMVLSRADVSMEGV